MKVALIGDVHGNLPALERVLDHAFEHGAEAIWNVGDFVGYGAFPDQVVKRLVEEGAVSIAGNYDRKTLKVKKKIDHWKLSKAPEKWLAFEWAYQNLSKPSRKYLRSLPTRRRLFVEAWRILLVHGSPEHANEYLTPATPAERMQELADLSQADIVVCGHSHEPFVRKVAGVLFINTGSVGRPDDGDPRTSYALLDLEVGSSTVTHFRLDYDIERATRAILDEELPEEFAQMIAQGRDLETIREASQPE